ncbi:activated RNA polymerase II transcriptional coactivator p15-like [Drosophila serrata]|uniref:activated RNA polymerase II transcriptional coactivator p15-like n=1 Tax=Drosophila serrata TaxID=7274 RepID=UPI000A1D110E|nr:activated RNA polymerase II transcriptional coactivator p15-like [Drosophila serrata]
MPRIKFTEKRIVKELPIQKGTNNIQKKVTECDSFPKIAIGGFNEKILPNRECSNNILNTAAATNLDPKTDVDSKSELGHSPMNASALGKVIRKRGRKTCMSSAEETNNFNAGATLVSLASGGSDGSRGKDGAWDLEKLRKVRIYEWNGRNMVDLRNYFERDGKILPCKRGVMMPIDQWKKLLEFGDEITRAAEN